MSAIVVTERCFYCSNFYDPRDMLIIGESVRMCQACRERHDKQVDGFVAPEACALCEKSTSELADPRTGELRMFAHWIDGRYGLLCQTCDVLYVQMRKDLYRQTRFGAERKV